MTAHDVTRVLIYMIVFCSIFFTSTKNSRKKACHDSLIFKFEVTFHDIVDHRDLFTLLYMGLAV